jgi:hypothetical protein
MDNQEQLPRIRLILLFFAVALFVSGATAIPLRFELNLLHTWFGSESVVGQLIPSLSGWITTVYQALDDIAIRYPFLNYGYDWLAFGHFVIAISFIGAIRDPVRNRWVVEYAMIACILLVPYALIMGEVRGIPIGWRVIDSLFGIVGIIPLYLVRKMILSAEVAKQQERLA